MLTFNYDYASCVRNAEKICWTVDEVMPPSTRLDFARPFLPGALSAGDRVDFLGEEERLKLNQITGHAYVNLFAFVEEYIIATAVKHAQAEMHGDHHAVRALVRFAEEELKHQELFHRYLAAFQESFGHPCGVLDNAAAVASVILSKSPMAVMLVTLHLEIMTQAHYTESVRNDDQLDPLFARLLKHHWLEEAQHAKIDALELAKLAEDAPPALVDKAFEDYLELIGAFDGLLAAQAKMDLESISRAAGRSFTEAEGASIVVAQHAAYRNTFLVLGMTNRMFEDVLERLSPEGAGRVRDEARALDDRAGTAAN
jgi:hypothetical protein